MMIARWGVMSSFIIQLFHPAAGLIALSSFQQIVSVRRALGARDSHPWE
jgi:hypothetical protein